MLIKATSEGIPWLRPNLQRHVFYNAKIINPLHATVSAPSTITIADGIIEKIEASNNDEKTAHSTEDQATQIDLQGKYNEDSPPLALKDAINDGVVDGPRLFICGHQLTQTGGHADMRDSYDRSLCCREHVFGSGILCDGVTECTRVARDELRRGADFIKIMAGGGVSTPTDQVDSVQFSPEEIRAITVVAKRHGTYVTCHAFTPESIRNAIENGMERVEHGYLIDIPTARLMAEKGVFLTPTLATIEALAAKPYLDFLPLPSQKKIPQILHAGLASLRIADEANVRICFGTDLLGEMAQFETKEFALRSQALSPEKILKSATTNAAKMLRQENFLGQVEEGFAADLLILNANPLDDITVLDRPQQHLLAVMKEGRVKVSRWSKLREKPNMAKIE